MNITERDPLIVSTAAWDAVEGRETPSIKFNTPREECVYKMCLSAILSYMRAYRENRGNAERQTVGEMVDKILQ